MSIVDNIRQALNLSACSTTLITTRCRHFRLGLDILFFGLMLTIAVSLSGVAMADGRVSLQDSEKNLVLQLKPDKCISLRQGLVCYQRIRLEWSVTEVGDYCLIEESRVEPLSCWSQHRTGTFITEFAAPENRDYYLIRKRDNHKLGIATMQVAWVYRGKKRSRRRWRLF